MMLVWVLNEHTKKLLKSLVINSYIQPLTNFNKIPSHIPIALLDLFLNWVDFKNIYQS